MIITMNYLPLHGVSDRNGAVLDLFLSTKNRCSSAQRGPKLLSGLFPKKKGLVIIYGEGGAIKWKNRGSKTVLPLKTGLKFSHPPF